MVNLLGKSKLNILLSKVILLKLLNELPLKILIRNCFSKPFALSFMAVKDVNILEAFLMIPKSFTRLIMPYLSPNYADFIDPLLGSDTAPVFLGERRRRRFRKRGRGAEGNA